MSNTSSSRQIVLERGQFLFLQGQPSESFYIMKSGRMEILVNEGRAPITEEDVKNSARRVAVLDHPNSPVGEIGVLEGKTRSASVRALDRAELIWVAGGQRAILEWVRSNLSAGLLIARALSTRVIENHKHWCHVQEIARRLGAYRENFIILYSVFNSKLLKSDTPFGQLVQQGRDMIAQFDQKRPPSISNVERNVPSLETNPSYDKPFPEIELAVFINTILIQPDAALEWVLVSEPTHPLLFMTTRLTDILPRISGELHRSMLEMEKGLKDFFGPVGLVQAYLQLYAALTPEQRESVAPYVRRLMEITKETQEHIRLYWGDTFPNARVLGSDIDQLERTLSSASQSAAFQAAASQEPGAMDAAPRETAASDPVAASKGSIPVVEITGPRFDLPSALAALKLTTEERNDADVCMGVKEGEPKHVYAAYWRLYPRLWRANLTANIPEITAFLRYGIASPTVIPAPEKFNLSPKPTGPILYVDQWLLRVYRGESIPSRNDLGQTYDEVLRENKATRYAPDEPEPMMDSIRYEIEQMVSKAARAFSAGRGEMAIVRRSPQEIDALADQMNSSNKIAQALVAVIRLDYTLFYRDVRVTLEERSEFLPKEILPFLIIIPASGDRALSWQEFEGRSKDTPGRLVYPLISTDVELFDATCAVSAKFRWELAKTIAGADWMNPADGGLTGRYFDYVEFFEKNPEFSDEMKVKLKEQFASARFDSDKFAQEYTTWLKYESQGIQRLNRVARRIFVEFCPFNIEARTKLIRQPAFAEILRKDSNKRLKRRQELERRIYKLERNGISIGNAFETALKIYQDIPE